MRVLTATVVDGRLDLPEGEIEDGATVTVLVTDEESFAVSPDEKAFLLASIAELERGEGVDGWELLEEIRRL